PPPTMTLNLTLQFSGGMELLFSHQKELALQTTPSDLLAHYAKPNPSESTLTSEAELRHLLPYIRDTLLTERAELFMQGDTVQPGILVLINDADWELEGELDYVLRDGDVIFFISTLHGG
ncbi:ubiquitin-related modifier 1, partial [Fimicolochytrium jonesii]|uniref:ubiquitin-related modifier 1 n=1 Tax=Fimicolochytrium jonesii TaxID=1396493 RepID=UPI0022FE08C4